MLYRKQKNIHIHGGRHDHDDNQTLERDEWFTKETKVLLIFLLIFRWLNSLLVQTSYVPDEYWQSVEIAHGMVFGYGYQTWEWTTGLRGYTYPTIFAFHYKVLQVLGLDYPSFLIQLPCLLQASFSAGQDFALYVLSRRLVGETAARWTLFCHLTSWFTFYTATRTLTNTMESVLTTIGLSFFLRENVTKEYHSKRVHEMQACFLMASLACIVRPTAAIIWLPLSLWHLFKSDRKGLVLMREFVPVGSLVLFLSVLVDRYFYGQWTFVQFNFLHFNVLHDMGSIYGSHPWHWYITQGVPAILGAHLPLALLGIYKSSCRKLLTIKLLIAWVVLLYSLLSHKEFRFILPILPLFMIFCGIYLSQSKPLTKKLWIVYILLLNIPVALYTGLYHQRGTIDLMNYLQTELRSHANLMEQEVFFLMPCHSTPYYSHLHLNAKLRFLTCPPNLEQLPNYIDEADNFYLSPDEWLTEYYSQSPTYPNYLIMFNTLQEQVESFLEAGQYSQIKDIFHTHFPDGRVGSRILVFHRKIGSINDAVR